MDYSNKIKLKSGRFWLLALLSGVTACASVVPQPPPSSPGHLQNYSEPPTDKEEIPPIVDQMPIVPLPEPQDKLEKYTVVVNEVPVKEILFALARDAAMNIDIDPRIQGVVTLNAVDQTLPQILDRVSRQVSVRYEIKDKTIIVSPDDPYFRSYKVDYVNMARDTTDTVSVATQISSTGSTNVTGSGGSGGGVSGGGGGLNNSTTTVTSTSNHRFWQTLTQNIRGIIGDKGTTGGNDNLSSENLVINPENGIITVRANSRQHEQIQDFIDTVLTSAQRQVLIEATVVDVQLNDQFQGGIDWNFEKGNLSGESGLLQTLDSFVGADPLQSFLLKFANGDISATLKLLRNFGNVKVLSSPRLTVMNNHTAVLKVVTNLVYFEVDPVVGSTNVQSAGNLGNLSNVGIDTTAKTVPIGLVMTVTPQINDSDVVTLNVRPTITSLDAFIQDPNPQLGSVKNNVPQIKVSEMESMLRINTGQVAVLGGLIRDDIRRDTNGIPILSDIPVLGDTAFKSRQTEYVKSELVIFLRPVVVHDASIGGDFQEYRPFLDGHRY